jgi:hypothetical protein
MAEFHRDGRVSFTTEEAREILAVVQPLRRYPDRPRGLVPLETQVMAASAPMMVPVERTLIRALVRYLRRLERDVGEGGFW